MNEIIVLNGHVPRGPAPRSARSADSQMLRLTEHSKKTNI